MTKYNLHQAILNSHKLRERGGGPFGIYYDTEEGDDYYVDPVHTNGVELPYKDIDGIVYKPLPTVVKIS
jgi:hypothetical protein